MTEFLVMGTFVLTVWGSFQWGYVHSRDHLRSKIERAINNKEYWTFNDVMGAYKVEIEKLDDLRQLLSEHK
jgi:hypothetical protein